MLNTNYQKGLQLQFRKRWETGLPNYSLIQQTMYPCCSRLSKLVKTETELYMRGNVSKRTNWMETIIWI